MNSVKIHELKKVTNPTSIHGIYPYRGKISALEAASIVEQLPSECCLLDPFCGSGTIVFEGAKRGIKSIGIDNNPLAIWLSEGKLNSLSRDIDTFITEVNEIIHKSKDVIVSFDYPETLKKHFHEESAKELLQLSSLFSEMSPYLKATFLGTIALVARGCNHYKWTSSTVGKDINPKQYINVYEKFFQKVKKHYSPTESPAYGFSKIIKADSRELTKYIPDKSIDIVFTSPPYFDGLDYTAYYAKIVYDIFGMSRPEIKEGLIQTVKTYREDMQKVFDELIRVTKDDALLIFVVGDKKVGKDVINGGNFFSSLLKHKPTNVIERSYTGTSSQIFDKLNRTERKEQIVVWDKSTWKI